MIELEKSNNGYVKSFQLKLAEKILRQSVDQKSRGQTYWKLKEDSNYKLKDGFLVEKARKKKE